MLTHTHPILTFRNANTYEQIKGKVILLDPIEITDITRLLMLLLAWTVTNSSTTFDPVSLFLKKKKNSNSISLISNNLWA